MVDLAIDGLGVGELIGGGASASVFVATRLSIGDRVAVKILKQTLTDEQSRSHFVREARALAELADIPGVVAVLDSGINVRGEPYLVFPLFQGSAQGDVTTKGAMDPLRAARMVAGAARAVHQGHLRGVIHRDLKPANLLLTNSDDIFVSDFGIAKLTDSSVSASGWLGLTPAYAPPEALEGIAAGVVGDVYSLGATLAALIIGAPPFSSTGAESPIALLNRVVNEPAPNLELHGASPSIAAVSLQAMSKDPSVRYQTALELAIALEDAISAEVPGGIASSLSVPLPSLAPPPPLPPVAPPPPASSLGPPPAVVPVQPVVAPPVLAANNAEPSSSAKPPRPPLALASQPTRGTELGSDKKRFALALGLIAAAAAIVGAIFIFRTDDPVAIQPTTPTRSTTIPSPSVTNPIATATATTVEPSATAIATTLPTPAPAAGFVTGGPIDVNADGTGEVATLADAIAAAQDGDVVRLAAGRYELDRSIRITNDITIAGAGQEETVLVSVADHTVLFFDGTSGGLQNLTVTSTYDDPAGDSTLGLVEFNGAESMRLDHVTVTNSTGFGVAVFESTGWITNSQFGEHRLTGVGIGGQSSVDIASSAASRNGESGFGIYDAAQVRLLGNTATNNGEFGFSVQNSSVAELAGNAATNNDLSGFTMAGESFASLHGNRSTGNGEAGFVWFDSASGDAIANHANGNELNGFSVNASVVLTLTGNTSNSNSSSGYSWAGSAGGSAVGNRADNNANNGFRVADESAVTLRANFGAGNVENLYLVDASAASLDESGIISVEADGSGDAADLASAISAAANGDVVRIGAGLFAIESSIEVSQDITVIGEGPLETTISVSGQSTAFLVEGTPFRVLELALSSTFSTDADDARFSLIELDRSEFVVDNVLVSDSAGIGLSLFSAEGTVTNSTFSNNVWSGMGAAESSDVTLAANVSAGNGQSGVVFFDQATGIVGGNTTTGNEFFGVSVQGASDARFLGNISAGNTVSGFAMAQTSSAFLAGNSSSNNQEDGFTWFNESGGSAISNRAIGNETSGFVMSDSASPSLQTNVAMSNQVDGFTWFEDSGGSAAGNLAVENNFDGFAAEGDSNPTLDRNAARDSGRRDFNQSDSATPTLNNNDFG